MSSIQYPDPIPDSAPRHLCLDCSIDISHRRRDAKRCEACSYLRVKERAKQHYQENRSAKIQYVRERQQTPEGKRLRQEWEAKNPEKLRGYRQIQKQRYREKTGYNPEGRTCKNCNADISHRGHNAKMCVSCSTPLDRRCKVCNADISNRGSRAQFCNEDCRQLYQQAKELQGYTKTCTKCNETKEHTEFGLHYNLRRPSCKNCETKEQSDRYHNFTPEQKTKRRNRRRKYAQRKRASQSSEERAMETIKRRKAYRRKLYGPDFDEDRLYSEQEGKCAICEIPKSLEELELDHDHKTDRLRGFLCKNCNFKLLSSYEKFPDEHKDSPYLNLYLLHGKQQ